MDINNHIREWTEIILNESYDEGCVGEKKKEKRHFGPLIEIPKPEPEPEPEPDAGAASLGGGESSGGDGGFGGGDCGGMMESDISSNKTNFEYGTKDYKKKIDSQGWLSDVDALTLWFGEWNRNNGQNKSIDDYTAPQIFRWLCAKVK